MINKQNISSLYPTLLAKNICLFDVRSPGEYEKGHIPGAINLPLFDNEERAIVGTAYKQVSSYHAIVKGLDIIGPKMSSFVKKAKKIAGDNPVHLYCWRGGKRSGSLAWLLDLTGFEVILLEKGYKAYRTFVQEQLNQTRLPLIVLGGFTGSGKTQILAELNKLGEQSIDLEKLCNHKGSAFGQSNISQPHIEQFENLLLNDIFTLEKEKTVWIENESRSIGRVFIYQALWDNIKSSPLIHIDIPFELRLNKIVAEYGIQDIEYLKTAFFNIKQKLGGLDYKIAIEALEKNDLFAAGEIALKYYDKLYQHSFDNNIVKEKYTLNSQTISFKENAQLVLDFYTNELKNKK